MWCAPTSCGSGIAAVRWTCAPAAPVTSRPLGRVVVLGGDLGAGQRPQAIVPGGVWQCAAPTGQEPVLVSCVVAPGFDYADFRLR